MSINNGTNGLQRLDKVIQIAESMDMFILLTLITNWNPFPQTIRVHGISCKSYCAISHRPDSLNELQPCPLCHQKSANPFVWSDNVSLVKGKAHRSVHLPSTHSERPMRVLTILSRWLIVVFGAVFGWVPPTLGWCRRVLG
jgi:hypothetical protein